MNTKQFILNLKGQIISGKFSGNKYLSCSFSFVFGKESWKIVSTTGESLNLRCGQTQLSVRSWGQKPKYTWNFPLEITFCSTNPSGWPKLVFTVSDSRGIGKDSIIGYGWCHVPLKSGKKIIKVPMFKPRSTSIIQKILSYAQKRPIEFNDPEFVSKCEGRGVTRVESTGSIKVELNVNLINFKFE